MRRLLLLMGLAFMAATVDGGLLKASKGTLRFSKSTFLSCMAKKMPRGVSRASIVECNNQYPQPQLFRLFKWRKCLREETGIKVGVVKLLLSLIRCIGQATTVVYGDPYEETLDKEYAVSVSSSCKYTLSKCSESSDTTYEIQLKDSSASHPGGKTVIQEVTVVTRAGTVTCNVDGTTRIGNDNHGTHNVTAEQSGFVEVHHITEDGMSRLLMTFQNIPNLVVIMNTNPGENAHKLFLTIPQGCDVAAQGVLGAVFHQSTVHRTGCDGSVFDSNEPGWVANLVNSCCV
ncbi:uncharacterized protein LOC106168046 [Lingula anatina]|uniref:Uncharacterized protein LOC106168046 n=1 Tax=Lingula anatina TaxID=7574 RepID=A0A1S3IWJ0_LINAN|nr:uncharacterized protein LOC106168046 [Lingula anatina]|eukprot:XP_013402428.1 uncharacterized protein LOC106168046 [Lingula anatina]